MLLDSQIASLNQQGDLMINFLPLNTQCMITGWEKGIRFYNLVDEHWQNEEIDPGFVLISDEYMTQKNGASYHFMQQIPYELQNAIKHFTQNQFTLLMLFSHNPLLLDIFKHSPNLVWMVAIEANKRKWTAEKTIKLLQQKREKITDEIIHSSSRSIVSFINKIQLAEGNEYEYQLIKECAAKPDIVKYFLHWKTIPTHALVVVRKFPVILKTNLLYDLIDLKLTLYRQQLKFSDVTRSLVDIEGMAGLIDVELPDYYFMRLKTIAAVNKAHDRLVEQLNELQISNTNTTFFPICPLGDTDDIKQIRNSTELAIEGKYMHHCVASYGERIVGGNDFIYKVLSPERATLHISKKSHNYDINQFSLVCNKKPSDESFLKIRQWLAV